MQFLFNFVIKENKIIIIYISSIKLFTKLQDFILIKLTFSQFDQKFLRNLHLTKRITTSSIVAFTVGPHLDCSFRYGSPLYVGALVHRIHAYTYGPAHCPLPGRAAEHAGPGTCSASMGSRFDRAATNVNTTPHVVPMLFRCCSTVVPLLLPCSAGHGYE